MLVIRLPQSIEKRLERLAQLTGRTKSFYARQAIIEYLDELENLYLAEGVLGRIRRGEERTIPLRRGTRGRELLKFAGAIDPRDLEEISEAIQEVCEKVEPNGW